MLPFIIKGGLISFLLMKKVIRLTELRDTALTEVFVIYGESKGSAEDLWAVSEDMLKAKKYTLLSPPFYTRSLSYRTLTKLCCIG